MISGAHVILYTADAEADRAFIRDVLAFPWVDAGAGWLIFKLPPAEVAMHPTEGPAKHEFYLMCDDLEETLADLVAKANSGTVTPADLQALQTAVSDLNSATAGVQSSATQAQADDPGAPPAG